jgi:hypothetical protein
METPPTSKQKVLDKAAIVPRAVWLRKIETNASFQPLTRCRLSILFFVGAVFWRIGATGADDETIRERKLLFMRLKSPNRQTKYF